MSAKKNRGAKRPNHTATGRAMPAAPPPSPDNTDAPLAGSSESIAPVAGPEPKTDETGGGMPDSGPVANQGDEDKKSGEATAETPKGAEIVETKSGEPGSSSATPDPIGTGVKDGQMRDTPASEPSSVAGEGEQPKPNAETPSTVDDPEEECLHCRMKAKRSSMVPIAPSSAIIKCADSEACDMRSQAQRKAGMEWTTTGWQKKPPAVPPPPADATASQPPTQRMAPSVVPEPTPGPAPKTDTVPSPAIPLGDESGKPGEATAEAPKGDKTVETKPEEPGISSETPDPIGTGVKDGQMRDTPASEPSSVAGEGKQPKPNAEAPPTADDPEVECFNCWVKAKRSSMVPFLTSSTRLICAYSEACNERYHAQSEAGMKWTDTGWKKKPPAVLPSLADAAASQPSPQKTAPPAVPEPVQGPEPKTDTVPSPAIPLGDESGKPGKTEIVKTKSQAVLPPPAAAAASQPSPPAQRTTPPPAVVPAPAPRPAPAPQRSEPKPEEKSDGPLLSKSEVTALSKAVENDKRMAPPATLAPNWKRVALVAAALLALVLLTVVMSIAVDEWSTTKTASPSGPCVVLAITDVVVEKNEVRWRCHQQAEGGKLQATMTCSELGPYIWPDRAPFTGDGGFASVPDLKSCRPLQKKTASNK